MQLTPGQMVTVVDKTDPNEQGHVSVLAPDACQHEETVCATCLDQWMSDHHVVLVTNAS